MKYEMIPSVKLADIVQEINDRHDIKITEYDDLEDEDETLLESLD